MKRQCERLWNTPLWVSNVMEIMFCVFKAVSHMANTVTIISVRYSLNQYRIYACKWCCHMLLYKEEAWNPQKMKVVLVCTPWKGMEKWSFILNHGTRCRWMVSFTFRSLYSRGKRSPLVLIRRLGGSQSRSGSLRKAKILHMPGI
jgi:hypothetical protein